MSKLSVEQVIQAAISDAVEGRDLSAEQAETVMEALMTGQATPAQIGALLVALRMKGETIGEVAAAAAAMRRHVTRLNPKTRPLMDTCGTGGDGSNTFNISTTVAFVVAASGMGVAKHGNRAASSQCGSADVLKALGVNVEAAPALVERCIDEAGIGFLFAPLLHPAMKHVIGPRRELKIRTMFNFLGPLTNPAFAEYQLIGVPDSAWTERLATVLGQVGVLRAAVVSGCDGLDEVTLCDHTNIAFLQDGAVTTSQFNPERVGLTLVDVAELRGGDADTNADILRSVLDGAPGPRRDVVRLNAAFALLVAEKTDSVEDGLARAAELIDSGAARERLDALVRVSNAGS